MKRPPTYQDLAALVVELTEANIANIDGKYVFVKCFTYGPGEMPPHWRKALTARTALIENRLALPRRSESE